MQKNSRWLAIVAVVVLALGALWYLRRESAPANRIDLVQKFAEAEKRSTWPLEVGFSIQNVTIDKVTKRCIYAAPHSRITYTVVVPPDAWLETAFALRPDSWDLPGDGAQFRVGISEGRTYEELLRQYINPKKGDRRWFTARLDLSAYEGRQVKVIFNTDPGPPGRGDTENDWTVWGEPQIYTRQ